MTRLSELIGLAAERAEIQFGLEPWRHKASKLIESGKRAFDSSAESPTLGILMTNDQATVELVFGAIMAGVRLVSLPLPGRGANPAEYLEFLASVCRHQAIAAVVARDDLASLLRSGGISARAHTEVGDRPVAAPADAGFQLVQFSSGSTASPKAVALDDRMLGANVDAIMEAVVPRARDTVVSWLPLSHDMGLVGMLLTSVASAAASRAGSTGTVLLTPESFLRAPATWMQAMAQFGGTYTAAPDFGYRLAMRHHSVPLDLSRVRCAIVGGEIVRADTLSGFARTFADSGWKPDAFCPAYGMAEVGLAVTMTPPAEPWRHVNVDPIELGNHRVTEVGAGVGTALVACGMPLASYRVHLSQRAPAVSALSVSGPSIAVDGYTGLTLRGADGRFETGDIGFVLDDHLFVCGREDDYLVVNGRNVYAPAVEAAVSAVDGVRPGRGVAVGLPTGDWIVCVEPTRAPDVAALRQMRRSIRAIATSVTSANPADVIVLRPGTLPMTSSGKLQRHRICRAWLHGSLDKL